MRRAAAAAIALVLSAMSVASVFADGYGLGQYHWVYPPKYQALLNTYPTGVTQRIPLSFSGIVETSDLQVALDISSGGSFGHPAGEHAITVSIRPLRHYSLPAGSKLKLDGNVYGFGFRYQPSGTAPTRTHKDVLITMDAPHDTPTNVMLALTHSGWHPLCSPNTMFLVAGFPACLTRTLPKEVAIFYSSDSGKTNVNCSHQRGPAARRCLYRLDSSGPSILVIAALAVAIIWLGFVVFVVRRIRSGRRSTRR